MAPLAVEMKGITKVFPGLFSKVVANNCVDLEVAEGEFHVIVGENGAGKSTLMNILYGMVHPDAGSIRLFGETVHIDKPRSAINRGIGMIHQHFMLVPSFTVAENIILGKEPTRAMLVDRKRAKEQILELSTELNFEIDPDIPVWETPVGVQQRVEIMKALYRGARILILDEPSAVLTPQEADVLFDALRTLCRSGTTVILITHKLPEVVAVADRVTVMRDGEVVGVVARDDLDEETLAEMMTGRHWSPDRLPRDLRKDAQSVVLDVQDLYVEDDRGVMAVQGASFQLREGEILALAGVAHNGQEELAEALMGQRPISSGSIRFMGKEISPLSVRAIRRLGIGHIPDDRYGEGCAREATVEKNMVMGRHDHPPLGNSIYMNLGRIRQWVLEQARDYRIKMDHPEVPIMSLSGGNVQKVIVAREISQTSRCLIAEQPSRGIDIGAAEFIYQRIIELRDAGTAVLLVSMDLTEVLRLSDRILVMFSGQVVGERDPEMTDQRDLGRLMAGVGTAARDGGLGSGDQ